MTGHRQPIRTCVACRTRNEKRDLIRFVLGPNLRLAMDPNQTLPGRGAYVCPDDKCILLASKKNAFSRALRTRVRIENPDALCAELNLHLAARGDGGPGH